ncbi:MAG TPA: hypothetical protein VMR98_02770 [Candidatus Polarisedimenticolaceae bacterium]|nr:hypothetical protein [Candidatus Polarisedimenticolaceae bacterium]
MNSNAVKLTEVVLFALFRLGGWEKRVHTEDIALECFKLFPSKFSWVRHPEYPDMQPARYALEDLKKPRNPLVEGESERKQAASMGGWRLTPLGVHWIEANRRSLEQSLSINVAPSGRLQGDKRLKSLLKSAAYKKYEVDGNSNRITHPELAEALVCTVNTEPKELRERLGQLEGAAIQLKNINAELFIKDVAGRLDKILTGEETS